MAHQFTRKELYEHVWSEPMKTLAARCGVSDAGLSKACRRYNIPVPERGYWAKARAGKKVARRVLPPRGPGMSDEVVVGGAGRYNSWLLSNEEILQATPSPPVFDRDMSDIAAEIRASVGKVTVPRLTHRPHRLIAKLLEADEERRRKMAAKEYVFSWRRPLFDSPFEKRRLCVLNSIFTALERQGMKPWLRGKEARQLGVHVNDENVFFVVDDAHANPHDHPSEYQRPGNPSGRMKVATGSARISHAVGLVWEDAETKLVERSITDIVVELIVSGERQYRAQAQRHYEWLLKRKADILDEERRRKEEAERKERERLMRLEQERVDRLLGEATALRQAMDIRAYVEAVRSLCSNTAQAIPAEAFKTWEAWAIAQADRIDPVVSGKFLESINNSADKAERREAER